MNDGKNGAIYVNLEIAFPRPCHTFNFQQMLSFALALKKQHDQ